jgi:hypothetical protein
LKFLVYRDKQWFSFTYKELIAFYEMNGWNVNEMLYGLMGPWQDDFATYVPNVYLYHSGEFIFITEDFIQTCMKSIINKVEIVYDEAKKIDLANYDRQFQKMKKVHADIKLGNRKHRKVIK